jgi:hypothetical protein
LDSQDEQGKGKDQSDAAGRGQNYARPADEILTQIEDGTNPVRKAFAQRSGNALGIVAAGFRQNQSPLLPLPSLATKIARILPLRTSPHDAFLDAHGLHFHD